MKYIKLNILLVSALAMLLSSCGGVTQTGTIGGSVTGLTTDASVVLQDNAGDNLTLSANGPYTFHTAIDAGSTYDVTILTQPIGENCVVENGIGVVEESVGNVQSVVVVCNPALSAANEVSGTVTGLNPGNQVILLDNGTDSVTVSNPASGTSASTLLFAIQPPLALNATYNVVVQTNPTGQTCTVTNGAGTITTSGQVPSGSSTALPVLVTCH